jgi:hypothetical protein
VVLVKRGFKSDGTFLPFLYRSSSSNFSIPPNTPEKVFMPAKVYNRLTLSCNPVNVVSGGTVTFTGLLQKNIAASNTKATAIPIAQQEVSIYLVKSVPVEGTILEKVVCKATTDAQGKYQVAFSPSSTGQYQALAAKPDGTTIAVSNYIVVKIR